MKKIFLYFFLFVLANLLMIQFILNPILQKIAEQYFRQAIVEYYRDLVRGPMAVVIKDLERLPQEEWADYVEALKPLYGFPIAIRPYSELKLPNEDMKALLHGQIIVKDDGDFFYQRVQGSAYVFTMGPIAELEAKSLEKNFSIFVWGAIGLTLSLFSLIPAFVLWRSLNKIGKSTEAFGQGDLQARVRIFKYSLLASIARAFNSMADHIEQLINSQRDLINAVSHELRTPIARVRFGLDLLKSASKDGDKERYVQGVKADIDELDNLVSELLTYARLERQTPKLLLEEQALVPWLKQVVEEWKPYSTSISYRLQIPPEPYEWRARFEPRFMGRALNNLLLNASRYADQEIRVSLEIKAEDCIIHVDDDGPGIPEADRGRLFKPFVRVDTSRDRASGGFGLGLAIVERVLKWHQGSAAVTDSPLGGARFSIQWPGLKKSDQNSRMGDPRLHL